MTDVRKGQAPDSLSRDEFGRRFRGQFVDPAYRSEDEALVRIEEIAWRGYSQGRKAPITKKAGPGYADPDYDLSVDWIDARARPCQETLTPFQNATRPLISRAASLGSG